MGIYHAIAEKVIELGRGSIDDIATHFPELSRRQIQSALNNAYLQGELSLLEKAQCLGKGKGSSPGVYGPPKEDPDFFPRGKPFDADPNWVRPVCSVFELGSRV
jgi:hypothetical protein